MAKGLNSGISQDLETFLLNIIIKVNNFILINLHFMSSFVLSLAEMFYNMYAVSFLYGY